MSDATRRNAICLSAYHTMLRIKDLIDIVQALPPHLRCCDKCGLPIQRRRLRQVPFVHQRGNAPQHPAPATSKRLRSIFFVSVPHCISESEHSQEGRKLRTQGGVLDSVDKYALPFVLNAQSMMNTTRKCRKQSKRYHACQKIRNIHSAVATSLMMGTYPGGSVDKLHGLLTLTTHA